MPGPFPVRIYGGHGDGGDGGVIDGIDGKGGSGVHSASAHLALVLPTVALARSLFWRRWPTLSPEISPVLLIFWSFSLILLFMIYWSKRWLLTHTHTYTYIHTHICVYVYVHLYIYAVCVCATNCHWKKNCFSIHHFHVGFCTCFCRYSWPRNYTKWRKRKLNGILICINLRGGSETIIFWSPSLPSSMLRFYWFVWSNVWTSQFLLLINNQKNAHYHMMRN